jgi:hypothetical protein
MIFQSTYSLTAESAKTLLLSFRSCHAYANECWMMRDSLAAYCGSVA